MGDNIVLIKLFLFYKRGSNKAKIIINFSMFQLKHFTKIKFLPVDSYKPSLLEGLEKVRKGEGVVDGSYQIGTHFRYLSLFVSLFHCLFVCLFVCLFGCLFVSLFVSLFL